MKRTTPTEKLLGRISLDHETGCLVVSAPNSKGYGTLALEDGRYTTTHRFAYELVFGDIPEGMHVHHVCRNRACANPWHLEVLTHHEHVLIGDSFSAQNARKTHCKHGHEFTPENTYIWRGSRHCRACMRARAENYRERRRSA